jgi:hypothetical protein
MEQRCYSQAIEIFPRKHCDFNTYIAKFSRAHSGASAEVKFPDYGKEMRSPGKRNDSRKALRILAPIWIRDRELSLAHAQMCIFLIIDQCCGPWE